MADMAVVPAEAVLSDNLLEIRRKSVIGNLVLNPELRAVPMTGVIAATLIMPESSRSRDTAYWGTLSEALSGAAPDSITGIMKP